MKIKLSDDLSVNYLKVGNGPHTIVLLPGTFGTIEKDFEKQLETLDKEKFTLVSWDPPGYGQSRPPYRDFHDKNALRKDAHHVAKLMELLEIETYSILGFCAGGATGLILAAAYPERVLNVVVWGTKAYVSDGDKENLKKFIGGETLSESANDANLKIYGAEELYRMYASSADAMMKADDICRDDLPKVKCPVLILHGEADNWIQKEHPLYLAENLQNAKIHFFPEGKHFIHRVYAEEFNRIVENFVLQ